MPQAELLPNNSFENDVQKRMLPDIERCGGNAVFDRVNSPQSAWHLDTNGYEFLKIPPLRDQLRAGTLLNQDDRKTRIGQFNADVVLIMDLTDWAAGRYGYLHTSVWDLRTQKLVWSARSTVRLGVLTPNSSDANAFTKNLMRKLRDDGMVPACGDASQAVGATTGHNDGSAPDATPPSH